MTTQDRHGQPQAADADPEFSHIVRPSALEADEPVFALSADKAALDALARRFGLPGIARFDAEVRLKWVRGGRHLRMRGELRAEVTQSCIVTLEPVERAIDEHFEVLFHPVSGVPEDAGDAGEEGFSGPLDVGSEPFFGDSLDIAEMVARELALALDPYPRKSGARLEYSPESGGMEGAPGEAGGVPERRKSPFEVLAALKGKK